jgi:hypothetical protein
MRIDRGVSNFFIKVTKKFTFKNRVLRANFFQELEYEYHLHGRCVSYRSKGKISSIVVRNINYGVEQRIFVNMPRLLIYFLKSYRNL